MTDNTDAQKNRDHWDRKSDEYQSQHGPQLSALGRAWGVWQIPEDDLQVLGEVAGKDILELGCGAAQWSIALTKRGGRMVGLDNSARQLEHARRNMAAAGVEFRLIHASAESVPLPDRSFDIVFCDHGAMSFADPKQTVPEVARLLRPGGILAFNMSSVWQSCCYDEDKDKTGTSLHGSYFGDSRWEWADGMVEYSLTYGEWIRLFRRNGFIVEDLIEIQPPEGATTTYGNFISLEWARRWPAENIWKVRKEV